jgi:hypothetical protein
MRPAGVVVRRALVDGGPPLLDLGGPLYARKGPAARELSPAQIQQIARTVHRAPEVMIKILNHGGHDLKAVANHLKYIDRGGELEIEMDDGVPVQGKEAADALIDEWCLDLDERWGRTYLRPRADGKTPKLVHKMIFSMPAGTRPEKVLAAVANFAREEFGGQHRYAMVLHTDEPHPHVHLVVRAMGHDGQRLNIYKATLRDWRAKFAHRLREQGVAANATARAARGVTRPQKLDGIHRAAMRGESTHYQRRVNEVGRELVEGTNTAEPGKERLLATRRAVVQGWKDLSAQLANQGELELALAVSTFVAQLPPPLTEKEVLRAALLEKTRTRGPRGRER